MNVKKYLKDHVWETVAGGAFTIWLALSLSQDPNDVYKKQVKMNQENMTPMKMSELPMYLEYGHGGAYSMQGIPRFAIIGKDDELARDFDGDGINDKYIICVDRDTVAQLSSREYKWFDLGQKKD